MREVLSSEESYIGSLNLLVNHYLLPLRKVQDKRVTKDLQVIFGNVEQILDLNNNLLDQLRDRVANWSETQLLGDIFIKIAPFLKLYSTYGTNYENAVSVFQREMKENIHFKEAVEVLPPFLFPFPFSFLCFLFTFPFPFPLPFPLSPLPLFHFPFPFSVFSSLPLSLPSLSLSHSLFYF